MANGDVAVVKGVGDVSWVRVRFAFVDEEGGGCSALCFAGDN